MQDELMACYSEISDAIVELGRVQTTFVRRDRGVLESNAHSIRSARALVASARLRLAKLQLAGPLHQALLNQIRARLEPLPSVSIVEPFGPLILDGGRHLEASGAANDRQKLEEILALLRECIAAEPDGTVFAATLDDVDRLRRSKVGVEWMLVTWENPIVWAVLFVFCAIALRVLLSSRVHHGGHTLLP